MDRQPVVAGQFYRADPGALMAEVRQYLALAPAKNGKPTILAMVPHAGYVYSGKVAGLTLGQADLSRSLLLLGPNHTGLGKPLAVWDQGAWLTPAGRLGVDPVLANDLLRADPRLEADPEAHRMEHSLEVLAPFLLALHSDAGVVPMSVSEPRFEVLEAVAGNLAAMLRNRPEPVSLVVSSDMSHYLPQRETKERDSLAIRAMLDLDPEGLLQVVRTQRISMCGVLPMTLGMLIARELGAREATLAAYATSGDASGDFSRVVGYAGILIS
jgi:MEMO1 family protein